MQRIVRLLFAVGHGERLSRGKGELVGLEVARLGQFIAQSSLLIPGLVLLVWGFQQRQVYEKRRDGRVKLIIAASLLAAFGLTVAVSMVVDPKPDVDDEPSAANIGPSQVESLLYDADKYVRSIDQVHVAVTNDDGSLIDITYVNDDDAVGSLTERDGKLRFIRIGTDMYVNPSGEFWKAHSSPEAIDYLDGRWIRADVDDKRWAKLTGLPGRATLQEPLTTAYGYTLGKPRSIHGKMCQVLTSRRDGSVVYISDSPRRMLRFEGGGGLVVELDYDAPDVTLKAPSRVLEASDVLTSG